MCIRDSSERFQFVESPPRFQIEEFPDGLPHRVFPTLDLNGADQRTVLDRHPFNVDQFHAMPPQKYGQRFDGMMAHMLMENRCNENPVNDVQQVLSFEEEQAV